MEDFIFGVKINNQKLIFKKSEIKDNLESILNIKTHQLTISLYRDTIIKCSINFGIRNDININELIDKLTGYEFNLSLSKKNYSKRLFRNLSLELSFLELLKLIYNKELKILEEEQLLIEKTIKLTPFEFDSKGEIIYKTDLKRKKVIQFFVYYNNQFIFKIFKPIFDEENKRYHFDNITDDGIITYLIEKGLAHYISTEYKIKKYIVNVKDFSN